MVTKPWLIKPWLIKPLSPQVFLSFNELIMSREVMLNFVENASTHAVRYFLEAIGFRIHTNLPYVYANPPKY